MVKRFLKILCLGLVLLFSACAPKGERGALASFGDSVMDTMGLTPPSTEFSQNESVVQSTATFSREEEYYLGRAIAARILARFKPVANETVQEYVETLGRALVAYSTQPETFGGFHFTVIDTETVNAISAPGGFIFISRGLLERLQHEDALSAVVAHEISHVTLRHGIRSISPESLRGVLESAGLLAGAISCDAVLQQAAAVFGATVDELVDTLLEKGYSKEFEYEADRGAAEILVRAGLYRGALDEVFTMLDNTNQSGGGWFSTHPDTHDRRQALGDFLSAEPTYPQSYETFYTARTNRYQNIYKILSDT